MPLRLQGMAASDGLFTGPVHWHSQAKQAREHTGNPAAEAADLQTAVAGAIVELSHLQQQSEGAAAQIIGFQIAMLEDPSLIAPCWHFISNHASADGAWSAALDEHIKICNASEDGLLQTGSENLADLHDRVLRLLTHAIHREIPAGVVLLGHDLSPSAFLSHDWSKGGAIVLRSGSATGQVAMLARTNGIAMVLQVTELEENLVRVAQVDGARGEVWFDPEPQQSEAFAEAK